VNRREFIRTAIATTMLIGVGAVGVFEVAAKAGANQASAQQQAQEVQLPPVGTETTSPSPSTTTEGVQSATKSSQVSAQSTQTSSAPQPSTVSSQSSEAAAPAGYVLVAQLSALSGKASAYFTHPTHGSSILLDLEGQWRAFSAICTHRTCTLEFVTSELYCPCHGATFSPTDGSVTRGPAQVTLGEYGVIVQGGGVYVSDSVVN
jgi:nitrite reductase/ring-hydroxylating ferredoxin subunit